ncbi:MULTISPECIES: hypothetical protein [unclassified Microbacterium]|uniref:hypothetical protein n=1 Tax=unclassified Microbacterium TaxID=2609290 RepID=UPI00160532F4|nr:MULTISPECIES: hypothetical protein [unclassified Microbacterium]QNA91270.1 hypothetical protein G4G29_00245 [Microbacterium sp. Se63.02b]QYM64412.1 hypothetical protein K1X59_00245 [Microbacterium sp. Se5.02b]
MRVSTVLRRDGIRRTLESPDEKEVTMSNPDVYPTDAEQPETQGDDPVEAELGEDGQGDIAPEDEGGGHSGDAPTDLRDGSE